MFTSAIESGSTPIAISDMRRPRFAFDRQARAAGRAAFGLVLLVGAGVLAANAITQRESDAAITLLLTWVCALAASGLVQLFTHGCMKSDREDRHVASWVVPTIGMALVVPLSLHALVAGVFGWLADFHFWVQLSLIVTLPAHIVFATMAGLRAYHIATDQTATSGSRIFATTVIVSCVPFVVMAGIPPLIVGATGLVILPLLNRMPEIIHRDFGITSVPSAVAHYKAAA